jgi:hypothetical protein
VPENRADVLSARVRSGADPRPHDDVAAADPDQGRRVPASKTWTVTHRQRKWIVKRRDCHKASSVHATSEAAIERATDLAMRYGGKLRIVIRGTGVEERTFPVPGHRPVH